MDAHGHHTTVTKQLTLEPIKILYWLANLLISITFNPRAGACTLKLV